VIQSQWGEEPCRIKSGFLFLFFKIVRKGFSLFIGKLVVSKERFRIRGGSFERIKLCDFGTFGHSLRGRES